jgi:ABC-type nitrate/sulfonate/bicarbonate transport system substrate-binding protein
LITVSATTKRFLRERREAADAYLRAYVDALAYVKANRDVTMKVIAKYTRQRDPDVLTKFYEDSSRTCRASPTSTTSPPAPPSKPCRPKARRCPKST